jgi:D-alanyl-D-alanine carboxypeptidase/D-alanyl-D-alanine-endopeptidase (penicillin-binding protein 4)
VRSAPIGDVLALALDQSDNALTEQLARIAAAHEGARTDFPSVARWVTRTVKGLGIDVTGVHLVDSCGLSTGTRIPARVIGDVLTLATTGRDRALQSVLSQLPVAGLTGTLYDRFLNPEARVADGIARAKTGSLPGVSSLAGTVLDRDGRLLVFVLIADNVRPFTPPAKGKAAGGSRERPGSKGVSGNAWVAMTQVRRGLDAVVARLADCGCRG